MMLMYNSSNHLAFLGISDILFSTKFCRICRKAFCRGNAANLNCGKCGKILCRGHVYSEAWEFLTQKLLVFIIYSNAEFHSFFMMCTHISLWGNVVQCFPPHEISDFQMLMKCCCCPQQSHKHWLMLNNFLKKDSQFVCIHSTPKMRLPFFWSSSGCLPRTLLILREYFSFQSVNDANILILAMRKSSHELDFMFMCVS